MRLKASAKGLKNDLINCCGLALETGGIVFTIGLTRAAPLLMLVGVLAGVVKLVDAEDSKSSGPCALVGSSPTSGTTNTRKADRTGSAFPI
jgi:hypothetical protein